MHKTNAGFTLLAPVKPDCVSAISELLGELHADQARMPFAQSSTTHFATITVIPEQKYCDDVLPATLLFATSFSGPTRVHVSEVVRVMGDGLRAVLQHCEGFTVGCSDEDLEEFLLEHRRADTFYSGMRHLSPECVRRHRELRDAIQRYIDERQERDDLRGSASDIRRDIQDYVKSRSDLAWAQEPFKPTLVTLLAFYWRQLLIEGYVVALVACTVARIFIHSTALDVIVAGGWIVVAAFLVFLVILIAGVREAEPLQTYVSTRPPDERARILAATQNRPVINEFTLGGPIKPEGVLRPMFLRISMWIIARAAEGFPGIPGLSTGINIPTVATARWIVADGGRRVMFISNFTNEGKAYVRDFIETRIGAMRINLSFGFGTGFPKTEWVIQGGALTDPNAYLHSLCENQLPTLFWYGPYRDISVDNIRVNRRIREGLFGDLSEREAQDWLHLL